MTIETSDQSSVCRTTDHRSEAGDLSKQGSLSHLDRCNLLSAHLPTRCTDSVKCLPAIDIGGTAAGQSASSILESTSASAQQKMAALDSLYASGKKDAQGFVHLQLHDGNKVRDAVIATHDYGNDRRSISLFARDDKGETLPVLRGIESGGKFERQVDKQGKQVDFNVENWSTTAQESSLGKVGSVATDSSEAPLDTKAKAVPEAAPLKAKVQSDPPDTLTIPGGTVERRPDHSHDLTDRQPKIPGANPDSTLEAGKNSGDRAIVTLRDRAAHYTPQFDSFSCSTTAMANVYSFQHGGPPPSAKFERDAGRMLSRAVGWEAGPNGMVNMFEREGLNAKDYTSNRVTDKTMADLNRELDQGHSAVLFVKNPHTQHGHFISVYGRDQSGKYLLGDPDSVNNGKFGHDKPVSAAWVKDLMSGLNGGVAGFVAAWNGSKIG